MEVFLFCHAPLSFQARAILVPINLMDVSMLAEMEKIVEKADEKGYIINHYVKCEDNIYGNILKSQGEHQDIIDILQKWEQYADNCPSTLETFFGADWLNDQEVEEKVPKWYRESLFYYGGFEYRKIFDKLKNLSKYQGREITIKHAILFQEIYEK